MYERKKNDQRTNKRMNEQANELINANLYTARKHLRTKVTPDLHLTYSKNGETWGWNQEGYDCPDTEIAFPSPMSETATVSEIAEKCLLSVLDGSCRFFSPLVGF